MFGIGFFELIIIAVVALVFVGPKRLPDLMRQAGRFFVQVRRASHDVRSTFDGIVRDAETELRREEAEALKAVLNPSDSNSENLAPEDTHEHIHAGHDGVSMDMTHSSEQVQSDQQASSFDTVSADDDAAIKNTKKDEN